MLCLCYGFTVSLLRAVDGVCFDLLGCLVVGWMHCLLQLRVCCVTAVVSLRFTLLDVGGCSVALSVCVLFAVLLVCFGLCRGAICGVWLGL